MNSVNRTPAMSYLGARDSTNRSKEKEHKMCATEKFWDFSIRTYDAEGVSDTCLTLQAEHGVDALLLLGCLCLRRARR